MRHGALHGALHAACAAALALAPGCLSVEWLQETVHQPPAVALDRLVPGQTDLGECLELLGAPLFVWEHRSTEVGMFYGWLGDRDWGVSISLPVTESLSASYDFNRVWVRVHGVALVFDEEERLRVVRRGYLKDVAPDVYRLRSGPIGPPRGDDAPGEPGPGA